MPHAATTHGHTVNYRKSREYRSWQMMKHRCHNPRYTQFRDYGGRGIAVCPRWRDSFEDFLADMGPRPVGTSIDRIDKNGNYEPSNCRWATEQEQKRNTRRNVLMTFNGKTQCLTDWAAESGIPYKTLEARRRYGWTDERALTQPVQTHRRRH